MGQPLGGPRRCAVTALLNALSGTILLITRCSHGHFTAVLPAEKGIYALYTVVVSHGVG